MSEVQHEPAKNRFTYTTEGKTARIDYEMRGDDRIAFLHTETPPSLQGQGIASRMAEAVLNYAMDREFHVLPYCPFIRKYIQEHDQFKCLVPESFGKS